MDNNTKKIYDLSNYDYELPEELIAQFPMEKRDSSNLLVLDKESGSIEHKKFSDIYDYLKPGDCLVLNNTKVIPARIYGKTEKTGAAIEVLILDEKDGVWEVMMKNSKRVKPGEKVIFAKGLSCTLIGKAGKLADVEFNMKNDDMMKIFISDGVMPLPPYIKEDVKGKKHRDVYQTVFATNEGAKAAPTAGFHFTKELLEKIKKKGIKIAEITLHVGLGTFEPVEEKDIRNHRIHSEYCIIDAGNAEIINEVKKNNGRIIAVGTTAMRTLESVADDEGVIKPFSGFTEIYIYPGYKFKGVDLLITNFHLPKTTLLALVSAFAGNENIKIAYKEAIKKKYRLFSYGDAMFIKK